MRRIPVHWLVFAGLAVYAAILAILTGDTGFQADDWWILSVPYWEPFPRSIWSYAVEFRRPLEGLPWLALFPAFGWSRTVYNLVALALYAGTTLFFGMSLSYALPGRRRFVAAAMLFSFFLPTVCSLTYVFHMDNIWMCTMLFWASTCAFQRWALGNAAGRGLILPVVLYYFCTLAYDAANLLIFLVPLFVYPCRMRNRQTISERVFWLRLGSAIAIGFAALVCTRFIVFSGGAIGIRSVVPHFDLIRSYAEHAIPYLTVPFEALTREPGALAAGAVVAVCSACVLFPEDADAPDKDEQQKIASGLFSLGPYVLICSIGLIVLGTCQYLMAGYGAAVGFHGESRIYSIASFGLAMLLGYLSTCWTRKSVLYAMQVAAVIALGFMAAFHADLRKSWQEAERINCRLWTSLAAQVPDVAPGTTFLFLDLQSYVSNRAIIFGGVNGLREFIRMFYNHRDIDAHFLYPLTPQKTGVKSRFAMVSPEGVVARGTLPSDPTPLDALLIVERVGDRLVLLDGISAKDKLAAIHWHGVSSIQSNRARILSRSGEKPVFPGVCCRWCGR